MSTFNEVVPPDSSAKFSYADLNPKAAEVAQSAAEAVHAIQRDSIFEVGRQLLRAKEVLPHGVFTTWAISEVGISIRAARNYMQAAGFIEGKPATVADLPPVILYALSAPSAPIEVVQAVVADAATGEPLNSKDIGAKLRASKAAERELELAQKRRPNLTREQLKLNKERQRRCAEADDARHQAKHTRDAEERQVKVRPLARQIATQCRQHVSALLAVLSDWQDKEALLVELRASLESSR
jgi:hypothetical protein